MKAKKVFFDETFVYVETSNNTIGKMPLEWFPKLKKASAEEQAAYELWSDDEWIHWEAIGEDLSVEGFFVYEPLRDLA